MHLSGSVASARTATTDLRASPLTIFAVVDDGRNAALVAVGFEQTAVIIAAPRAIRGHGPIEGNGMRRRCEFAHRLS